MKQKIKQGFLGLALVGLIAFSAVISGVIPSNKLPKVLKPFASILITADEEYLDQPCTPELCGEDQVDEAEPVAESKTSSSDTTSETTQPAPTSEKTPTPTPTPTKPTSEPKPAAAPVPQKTPAPKPEPAPAVEPTPVETHNAADESPTPELTPEATPAEIVQPVKEATVENKIAQLEDLQKVVKENKVFSEILGADGIKELEQQAQQLRIEKPLILVNDTPAEQKKFAAETAQRIEKVTAELKQKGADEKAIQAAVVHERKKISAERTRAEIQKISPVKIKSAAQDSDGNGFSDEAEAVLGKHAEALLFGVEENPAAIGTPTGWKPANGKEGVAIGTPTGWKPANDGAAIGTPTGWKPADDANRPITMGLKNGSQLNKDGFTALISGAAGVHVKMVAINAAGEERVLGRGVISENNKAVIVSEHKMPAGNYAVRAVRDNGFSQNLSDFGKASVIDTAHAASNTADASKPVIVQLTDDETLEAPTVKHIQNLDIAGLRNIKVTTNADGKIKVTGSADINAVVVGTFQSAVFTSAILADVDTGLFEVTSSDTLEQGEHEVTIFSTNPSSGSQSKPAQVKFSIVPTAQAASVNTPADTATTNPIEKNPTLLIGVSTVIGIGLLVVIALLMRKKKDTGGSEQ